VKVKVFLKYDRPADMIYPLACLRHWLEIFKGYDTYILCDLYNPSTDKTPEFFKTILLDYPVTVINSDYSIGSTYCQNMKKAKRNMASANISPFLHLHGADAFWIIDADDTRFLSAGTEQIQQKLKSAEQHMAMNNLDAFSLDFYRNLNNGWTFGVALISARCNWKVISSLTEEEIAESGYARNIDTAFHILGSKGIFKIANFIFDGECFQHVANNYPEMPHGIYSWYKGKLWDKPLQSDVVIL
jgi:hypothetical protein